MSFDLSSLREAVARETRVARVVVAEAKGSAPREAGAAMLVWADGQSGTIGGGALEWEATARARALLAKGGTKVDRLALGPELQQCCGGRVTLVTEVWDAGSLARLKPEAGLIARALTSKDMPLAVRRRLQSARGEGLIGGPALIDDWMVEPLSTTTQALWIWGAGHVGRALVTVLAPMPDLAITWVDTAADRFPAEIPKGVEQVIAADPALLVPHAPREAEHLILTYSHVLDLALCHALLGHGFSNAGLIGSATKWVRFRKRLTELGHAPTRIADITCPIGDPSLGKHPQAIAISVGAEILGRLRTSVPVKKSAR